MPNAGIPLVWAKPQDGPSNIRAPDAWRGHSLTLLAKEYKSDVLLFGGKDTVSGCHMLGEKSTSVMGKRTIQTRW